MNSWSNAVLERVGLRGVSRPAVAPTRLLGSLEEVSAIHVAGWMRDAANPDARVAFEVRVGEGGEVLARGVADQFRNGLAAAGAGDGAHGFVARMPRALNQNERDKVVVRAAAGSAPLPRQPIIKTNFEPLLHVAMDIVDNCNLRCPFCLYDYANTRATHLMTAETLEAALRFMPFTRDGEFFFSCLHEPTLHPELVAFVDRVPLELRRKVFFTTNVAKRMPASYYAWLADTALHHINISIESLKPELYERMRKGARHRIFVEQWDMLLRAFEGGVYPPRIRYIVMVYKSNVDELPDMVRYLLEERRAWQVELRYTFDVPHMADGFRQAEFLDYPQWLQLRERLAEFPSDRVQLSLPPDPDAPARAWAPPGPILPDYYMLRMSWDGSFRVFGVDVGSRGDDMVERQVLEANVGDVGEPLAFLDGIQNVNASAA